MSDRSVVEKLMRCAANGDIDGIKLLIAAEADVNARDRHGRTALGLASGEGHFKTVSALVEARADVDYHTESVSTALIMASSGDGHAGVVSTLIKAGADLNIQKHTGSTALYIAAQNGSLNIVAMLLQAEADVNIQRKDGASALEGSCQCGHLPVVNILLEKRADVNNTNTDGISPLHRAAGWGHPEIVKLLLHHKAAVNARATSYQGITALMQAAARSLMEIIDVLISNSADILQEDRNGRNSIGHALKKGHAGVANYLNFKCNRFHAIYSLSDLSAVTLLRREAEMDIYSAKTYVGSFEIVVTIKSPNMQGNVRWSALSVLKSLNYDAHLIQFIGVCIDFNGDSRSITRTALITTDNGEDLFKYFTRTPAYTEPRQLKFCGEMARGLHALHGCKFIHKDICLDVFGSISTDNATRDRLVLKNFDHACGIHNADVEPHMRRRGKNHLVWTPPEIVDDSGYSFQSDVFSLGMAFYELATLCRSGAGEFDQLEVFGKLGQFSLGKLPLEIPAHFHDAVATVIRQCCATDPKVRIILHELISSLPDVDQKEAEEPSNLAKFSTYTEGEALVEAVSNGDLEMVEFMLCNQNVSPDACTRRLWTPLLEAIAQGNEKIIRFLLQHKANVQLACRDGFVPIVLAAQRCNLTLMESLIELNANVHTTKYPCSTDLHNACLQNCLETVKVIISAGIRPAIKYHGKTTLQTCSGDTLKFMKSVDKFGPFQRSATMLMKAAYYGEIEVVKKLVSYGVNVDLKDMDIKSATDYAREQGHEQIVDILRNKKPAPLKATFYNYSNLSNIEPLGQGQFGVTYQCTLSSGKQSVTSVAKVSKLKPGDDEWRELQVLKILPHHDSVLSLVGVILDFKHDEKVTVALLVPFMTGGSLESYVESKAKSKTPLTTRTILRFTHDMAVSVGHLHSNGYVHMDIAQRNYLISKTEVGADAQHLVVADFGLSRQIVEGVASINKGEVLPVWAMPPEMLNSGTYSSGSDVWQIGLAIWEFQRLSKVPFRRRIQFADFPSFLKNRMVIKGEKVPLRFRKTKHVPDELLESIRELCETCCTYDVADRPATEDVAQKIEAMIASLPEHDLRDLQEEEKQDASKVTYGGLGIGGFYTDQLDDNESDQAYDVLSKSGEEVYQVYGLHGNMGDTYQSLTEEKAEPSGNDSAVTG